MGGSYALQTTGAEEQLENQRPLRIQGRAPETTALPTFAATLSMYMTNPLMGKSHLNLTGDPWVNKNGYPNPGIAIKKAKHLPNADQLN